MQIAGLRHVHLPITVEHGVAFMKENAEQQAWSSVIVIQSSLAMVMYDR